jgi:hypothetical protein
MMIKVTMEKTTKSSHLTSSWDHLKTGISLVRENPEPVIITAVLPSLAVQLGALLLQRHVNSGTVVMMLGGLWLLLSMPAVLVVQMQMAKRHSITAAEAYSRGFTFFWRILGLTIITGFLILLGLLCFIVPGVMLFRRWSLASYYVIDKDLGIREAMKRSWEDTNRAAGYVWGTIGVAVLVSIAASFLGMLFAAIPGGSAVVTSIVSLASFLLLPLRYMEVSRPGHASSNQ